MAHRRYRLSHESRAGRHVSRANGVCPGYSSPGGAAAGPLKSGSLLPPQGWFRFVREFQPAIPTPRPRGFLRHRFSLRVVRRSRVPVSLWRKNGGEYRRGGRGADKFAEQSRGIVNEPLSVAAHAAAPERSFIGAPLCLPVAAKPQASMPGRRRAFRMCCQRVPPNRRPENTK